MQHSFRLNFAPTEPSCFDPEHCFPGGVVDATLTPREASELFEVALRGVKDHAPLDGLIESSKHATSFLGLALRGIDKLSLPESEFSKVKEALEPVKKFRDDWKNLVCGDWDSKRKIDHPELIQYYRAYSAAVEKLLVAMESHLVLPESPTVEEYWPLAINSCKDLNRILESQIDLLTLNPRYDVISSDEFLKKTLERINNLSERNTTFEIESSENFPILLHMALVQRTIAECWNNADCAGQANGKKSVNFKIHIEREGEGFVIIMQDNAGGFPVDKLQPSEQAKPTEQFPRIKALDLNETSKEKGGVGLTEMYYIMRAHHGEIEVKSSQKEGSTTIKLHFPRNSLNLMLSDQTFSVIETAAPEQKGELERAG